MNYKEAINASQNWAARGYNQAGICEVAICHYGGKLMWLPGFGGNWAKDWEPFEEGVEPEKLKERLDSLAALNFYPTGPKPEEQVQWELLEALSDEKATDKTGVTDEEMRQALEEIADEYEWADEMKDDYFEPMGETYE